MEKQWCSSASRNCQCRQGLNQWANRPCARSSHATMQPPFAQRRRPPEPRRQADAGKIARGTQRHIL
eukprot:scaffold107516_cov29-Tisochrysis_lutea.AAC.3